jgi:hypothetical protein
MRNGPTLLFLAVPALWAANGAKNATFYKDVLPVLQNRCQECHRPGEIGPFSLMTYQDARPWAKAIKTSVLAKKMPPWHADKAHGKFVNDRSLSQSEIDTLAAWADGGAKEGNKADAPKPVNFPVGWQMGKPDVVLEMPNEFVVPASGKVDYAWIVVPTGFTEDKWIEAVEVRPSALPVVHHVVLYSRAPGSKWMSQAKPGVPFFPPGRVGTPPPQKDTGRGVWEFMYNAPGVEISGLYVPGGQPYLCRPGQARLIKAGSDLVFQMHYTTNGKEMADRTRVGLRFAKEPPKERVFNTFLANPWLQIPPGEGNHEVQANFTLPMDVTLLSMNPHAHVRGKAFKYEVTYPTGENEVLLHVPRYDFNWQISYYLEKPKTLPKGTKMRVTAWYDNSVNNPANPDATKTVLWGDQTWEEMLAAFMDFVVPVDFEPNHLVKGRPVEKAGK